MIWTVGQLREALSKFRDGLEVYTEGCDGCIKGVTVVKEYEPQQNRGFGTDVGAIIITFSNNAFPEE